MLSQVDEKVTARYADIHRRIHEDVAGVELRLDRRMSELALRMSDLEVRLIRWMVSLMVVQGGLMIAIAWATKHLL